MEVFGIGRPRRIVTGLRDDGTSYFARVEEVEPIDFAAAYGEREGAPTLRRMWAFDEFPELPVDGKVPQLEPRPTKEETPEALQRTSPLPTYGGVRVNLVTFPPCQPGVPPRPSELHWHDTVDFAWLIAGELVIRLDDGSELMMEPGDLVIQHGTNHAWEARTETGAVLAVMIRGAKRLGVSPPSENRRA